ncbi:MAG: hypothetical protein IPO78_10675 [Saprospiraceae bacterium]|nr:hypothetical protein [Saprospiraceae bacterium]MBK8451612.1 hypothetical protein [Saprospiraceae bacterium]MBK9221087.1 hypothetical protein [Saprospiraceae bacterium]MBK9722061.1 hypothetical protein [Saprospiraceae bacterium]MBK9729108.1 hypothetical protein [Saprospiraceae bacterium]
MKNRITLLLYLLTFLGCKQENKIDLEFLKGKWVIVEASRNTKRTNTLDGAFFFFEQNILTTNFMGSETQANYILNKNELTLTKGLDYTFQLEKTRDHYLLMHTKIQKADFLFKLKKE